jgi:transposase
MDTKFDKLIKEVFHMTKRYDETFKNEAIRLALSGGKSIAETARDLGIKETLLYNWISKAKQSKAKIPSDEFQNASELVDELNRLRKENARLKEEREILKKAAAFFAKEEQKR